MIVGHIVEMLIQIKDELEPMSEEQDAVIEACNILDKLPRLADSEEAKRIIGEFSTRK